MKTSAWKLGRFAALLLILGNLIAGVASAVPVDFTEFEVDWFPQTNGPLAEWITTTNEAMIDDVNTNNASVNVFYGPDSSIVNKRITGTLTPGTDDDAIGFVLGFMPGDADFFNFPDVLDADYLLVDWKGITQTFTFNDSAGSGISFHSFTLGGEMPVGLALSRVSGIPTADELWQHIDSLDNLDGGVEQLARGTTLGGAPYPRDNSSVNVDIRYTASNVTVLIDGVEELNVDGAFPDGHFGLYSFNHGPSAIWSDFDISDLLDPISASVNRDTGEILISNATGSPLNFASYSIGSADGGLIPENWTSITDNYDDGGAGSVDADPWSVAASDIFGLAEQEETPSDGATLADGQAISLGNVWTPSPFEVLQFEFVLPSGDTLPVDAEFINGPGGGSFGRSDLNADGQIDQADWQLFFPNTLTDLSALSTVQAYLHGDLDGDLDNDVIDFGIFKGDFELANGAGSFARMTATPEPSTVLLLLIAGVALWVARRKMPFFATAVCACVLSTSAQAQPLDFTQFTLERFPPTNNFAEADWDATASTAAILGGANASANVFYSPENVLGKRIRGFLDPSTDDDIVGFVLGFLPGNASFGPDSSEADYLLLDWKGTDQAFDFADPAGEMDFNNLTGGGPIPAGIAFSRVSGLANADELWQHQDLEENTLGGVVELSRAFTLGSTGYDRADDAEPVEFDILFTENLVSIRVNGVLQFNEPGVYSDGRFGLYTGWQSASPTYTDFELLDASTLGDIVLSATVQRSTGDIELTNNTGSALVLDYYQLDSASESLRANWQGLADGESGGDADPGFGWVEAGGASTTSLAELYLEDSTGQQNGFTLDTGASVTLLGAYNGQVNGEDLLFSYRTTDGVLDAGLVSYEGDVSPGVSGDYDGDNFVGQGDIDLVLLNWGDDVSGGPPSGWTSNLPTGSVDQDELDAVLLNWGSSAAAVSANAVPEPNTLLILALLLCGVLAGRNVLRNSVS